MVCGQEKRVRGNIDDWLPNGEGPAAGSGMTLNSPAAVTDMRVEGAVFLALAALTLLSLLDKRRLLAGLGLIATVVGFVTAARVLGYFVDGPAAETTFKLVAEVVLLALSSVGILAELGRRRHVAGVPHHQFGSPVLARSLLDGRGALDNGATIDAPRHKPERAARLFAKTR